MNANELADGILAIEERIFLTKKEHQLFQNSATMLRQLQTKVDSLEYNADLHTKKIYWLAINYPDVNNHLFETIKTGEIYNVGEK